jgi:tetratricopeptide (TPR) repeat protein
VTTTTPTTTTRTTATTSANHDEHGNPITGPADAVARYDAAIDNLLRYHVDVVDQMSTLAHDHPTFAMGQALAAYLHLMSSDPNDLDAASPFVAGTTTNAANARERAHAVAIAAWAAGDWHGAARYLDDLLVEWPTDLLALAIGHQLDFFTGDARNLRDRVGRSLGAFDPRHPHRAFVRGMQAFGLEESGHYGAAEEAGMEAVERNPDDVWGIHAVAHVHEMQGQVDRGIEFMTSRTDDWGSGNLFTVHNWWHLALYLLERDRHDEVIEIYDTRVHHADSDGVPLEMVDASALLWRLHLDGVDVGGRFDPLADAWSASLGDNVPWYAFNDVHAVMAFAGAGRLGDATAVIDRLANHLRADTWASNHHMTAEVGLPVSQAVLAFGEGRYDDSVDTLWSARRTFHHFGGSHAQRDALERTLVEAAVRAGRRPLAERLVSERLAARPTGTFALDRLRRLDPAGD